MDQSVLRDITKASSSRMVDHDDLDLKIEGNVCNFYLFFYSSIKIIHSKIVFQALPPLPPLTPISKLQTIRRTPTIEQQQTIQYKNVVHTSASLNLPKSNNIMKNVCFVTDDDEANYGQSNAKLLRQNSKEQTIAPKKSLPHKKRITKKLKSISPNMDQMQAVDSIYQSHHDMTHLQGKSHYEHHFSVSDHQQNETLNLAMNSQPIQLTTSRIDHNQSTNQTDYIPSDQYTAANSMHAVQMQQMPIDEHQPNIQSTRCHARFACEICGMQAQTQLAFYHHLKLHYEPEISTNPQNCKIDENVRNDAHNPSNITSSLDMEQNNQNIFQMENERKLSGNQCIPGQPMNQPVIMTDNYVRLQNNEQDFSCISGIGNEDVTDDESMNGYNDTALSGIKAEQNEFSDTEDMLENGVLDKVQRVVDSYIENGTSDVKNLIDMNESQHHSSLVDNWTTSNTHPYTIDKNESVSNINATSFVITANNQSKEPPHTTQNHIISNQSVIERPEELTLIYEINVNDKDFPNLDDTSTESEY